MKVIILTGEPFPNGMAATNRIKCYAHAIKEGGIDCEVLIFRRTEVYGKQPKNVDGQGTFEGILFRFIGGTPLRGSHAIIRQLNDRVDAWRTKKYLNRNLQKGDVLFFYMGEYVKLMLRFMSIARKKGAFCVQNLDELPYGTSAETKRAIQLRKTTLEQQLPKIDGVISISDALFDLAKRHTRPSCKHIKVPIMVEYNRYCIKESLQPEIPYIFHAGTLSQQKDGILGMLEAFGMAKKKLNKPIKYILTGNIETSSHPEELRQIIQKYNLEDSVEFVGYLNRDQIREYLANATLVISNRPKSQQDYYGFSTKVGEYLASGTPLLMTNWGEAVNWLENGRSAYIIEPEDTDALADAIVHVFTHPEESKQIGITGQEVCRQCFDYRNWSKPIVDFFNQLGN